MINQQELTEQYNQVEALYKQMLSDVRASGLDVAGRFVWYTRIWQTLDNATADSQIAALTAVRVQWDQRAVESSKDKEVSQ